MGGCFDLRGNTLIISNKATIPEAFGTTLAHYPSSHSARFKTVIECAFYSNKLMLCRGIASPSFFFFQSVSSSDEVTAKANCRDLKECFSLKKFEAPLPKNTSTQKTSKVTQIVIQAKNPLQRFFFFSEQIWGVWEANQSLWSPPRMQSEAFPCLQCYSATWWWWAEAPPTLGVKSQDDWWINNYKMI